MYLIKLALLQSGTGQSEFIGNFLRGGGAGNKTDCTIICQSNLFVLQVHVMAWAQLFCEVSHNKYVTLELNCKAMKQFAYLSIHVDPKQYTSYWWTNFRRCVHSVKTVNQKRDKLKKHHSGKKNLSQVNDTCICSTVRSLQFCLNICL